MTKPAISDGRARKRPGVAEQTGIITRAAVALFSERGAAAVSIAQICERAGVSRPTYYRCFEDKEALLAKIYEEAVNMHAEAVLTGARLRDPDQLRVQLAQMLDAIFSRPALAAMLFAEAGNPRSPAAAIVERNYEHAADVLSRDLRRSGREVPSRVYIKSVMAAVAWIAQDAIRKGLSPEDRSNALEAVHTLVIKALAS